MRELVIVVSDLYFASAAALHSPSAASHAPSAGTARLPGLARLMRFGTAAELPQGWRPWLATWLGREDLVSASPGAVAACTAAPCAVATRTVAARTAVGCALPAGARDRAAQWAWLADPLHLTASLTSLHLTPQGLLRLDPGAQAELCAAFDTMFGEMGYTLVPTRSGRFLARGPVLPGEVRTTDPTRVLGSSLSGALPEGPAASALRRLGAEIEMWLHEHPLNAARARAGRPPISTLWLWGGGAPIPLQQTASAAGEQLPAGERSSGGAHRSPGAALFGDDPYMEGLSRLVGATCGPVARSLSSLPASEGSRVVQLELFSRPADAHGADARGAAAHASERASATLAEALEALDRAWVEPAHELLARGEITRLVLIANDRRVTMASRDRFKRWRRSRGALAALERP